MKLRRKICCQENVSISSVGVHDTNKYAITDNDELNRNRETDNMENVS